MRILLTILEFVIIFDLATTIIRYTLKNKVENIDEEVAKIDFNIEGLEIAAKIIEILKNPTSELTEEQKDQCREFCNNIYSDDKYSGAGLLYIMLVKNKMLDMLPPIIIGNFKFQEAKKEIFAKMKQYKKSELFDEKMWQESIQALSEDLKAVKNSSRRSIK